ncbi:MAG: YncE family protein, partial [Candidatus Bathyanammoxibius sp.]
MSRLLFAVAFFAAAAMCSLSATAEASPLSDRDVSTLVFVTNRDSNDVVAIDPATATVVSRYDAGSWCAPHMSTLTHDGQKLVVPGTKRNDLMVFDVASGKMLAKLEVGLGPEH